MAEKRVIVDKPKVGDTSQYNFSDNETDFDYKNSTGFPKNNDKFQDKDLYSLFVDNEFNIAIINGNLQFEAESYFSIEECNIKNAGVNSRFQDIDTRVIICEPPP